MAEWGKSWGWSKWDTGWNDDRWNDDPPAVAGGQLAVPAVAGVPWSPAPKPPPKAPPKKAPPVPPTTAPPAKKAPPIKAPPGLRPIKAPPPRPPPERDPPVPDVLDTIAEEEPSHSNTTWMVQRSWVPHFSPEALAVAGVSSSASGELHLGDGPAVAGPQPHGDLGMAPQRVECAFPTWCPQEGIPLGPSAGVLRLDQLGISNVGMAVLDTDHFKRSCLRNSGDRQSHNAALKWLRDEVEPRGVAYTEGNEHFFKRWELPFDDPVPVRAIIHDKTGPGYRFDPSGPAVAGPEWYWRQMICHLDADSMNRVVHGPESRSRGIIGCWFSPRPGSYDHVRANQNKGGDRLPIWDFQVLRDDGTCIYLHPPWKGNKIDATEDITERVDVAQFVSLPKHGHGQSDGRGTFQSYKKQQRSVQLKFASPSELNSGVCNSSESKSEVRIDFAAMDE